MNCLIKTPPLITFVWRFLLEKVKPNQQPQSLRSWTVYSFMRKFHKFSRYSTTWLEVLLLSSLLSCRDRASYFAHYYVSTNSRSNNTKLELLMSEYAMEGSSKSNELNLTIYKVRSCSLVLLLSFMADVFVSWKRALFSPCVHNNYTNEL